MLGSEKYEAIFGGIIYFIGLKSGTQKTNLIQMMICLEKNLVPYFLSQFLTKITTSIIIKRF